MASSAILVVDGSFLACKMSEVFSHESHGISLAVCSLHTINTPCESEMKIVRVRIISNRILRINHDFLSAKNGATVRRNG